jgi:hypothetical protein
VLAISAAVSPPDMKYSMLMLKDMVNEENIRFPSFRRSFYKVKLILFQFRQIIFQQKNKTIAPLPYIFPAQNG